MKRMAMQLNSVQEGLLNFFKRKYYVDVNYSRIESEAAMSLLNFLKLHKVEVIAADFDLTITDQHSGGFVLPNENTEVFKALSKEFDEFAEMALNEGFKIVVVTFADEKSTNNPVAISGNKLVARTLKVSKARFEPSKIYPFFPKNYQNPDAYSALGLEAPMENSKSYHLNQVCKDFQVEPHQVILIDDTIRNCVHAIQEGYLALTLRPSPGGFRFKNLCFPTPN
eukprot:Platyproteum_vivax@DN4200_c0_g1_i1.p1